MNRNTLTKLALTLAFALTGASSAFACGCGVGRGDTAADADAAASAIGEGGNAAVNFKAQLSPTQIANLSNNTYLSSSQRQAFMATVVSSSASGANVSLDISTPSQAQANGGAGGNNTSISRTVVFGSAVAAAVPPLPQSTVDTEYTCEPQGKLVKVPLTYMMTNLVGWKDWEKAPTDGNLYSHVWEANGTDITIKIKGKPDDEKDFLLLKVGVTVAWKQAIVSGAHSSQLYGGASKGDTAAQVGTSSANVGQMIVRQGLVKGKQCPLNDLEWQLWLAEHTLPAPAASGPARTATVPPPAATVPPPAATPTPTPVSETFALVADALFDPNKSILKDGASAKLDDLVNKVKSMNLEVIIVAGHTDSDGSDTYNQRLSLRRAEAVKAYLVSNGIEANRVSTEGKGEKQPIADNKTREGKAKNRRVEIEVVGTRAKK